jgi:hypothetical protein
VPRSAAPRVPAGRWGTRVPRSRGLAHPRQRPRASTCASPPRSMTPRLLPSRGPRCGVGERTRGRGVVHLLSTISRTSTTSSTSTPSSPTLSKLPTTNRPSYGSTRGADRHPEPSCVQCFRTRTGRTRGRQPSAVRPGVDLRQPCRRLDRRLIWTLASPEAAFEYVALARLSVGRSDIGLRNSSSCVVAQYVAGPMRGQSVDAVIQESAATGLPDVLRHLLHIWRHAAS